MNLSVYIIDNYRGFKSLQIHLPHSLDVQGMKLYDEVVNERFFLMVNSNACKVLIDSV